MARSSHSALPRIFISYAHDDQALAQKLQEALLGEGAEVFVYYAQTKRLGKLPKQIKEALQWCDTLVLLWSQHAANSPRVKLEWSSAMALKRNLIFCLLDNAVLPKISPAIRCIDFTNFDHGLGELLLALGLKIVFAPPPYEVVGHFRPLALNKMSEHDFLVLLHQKSLYEFSWEEIKPRRSPRFQLVTRGKQKLVTDRTTGLTWQQSGSSTPLTYADAERYIQDLNRHKFGNSRDWQVPSLDEAMTLLMPKKMKGGLYLDSLFDGTQSSIWTAGESSEGARWVVTFSVGYCYVPATPHYFVRAVHE